LALVDLEVEDWLAGAACVVKAPNPPTATSTATAKAAKDRGQNGLKSSFISSLSLRPIV